MESNMIPEKMKSYNNLKEGERPKVGKNLCQQEQFDNFKKKFGFKMSR